MEDSLAQGMNAVVFVVGKNAAEREALLDVAMAAGCAVIPLDSIAAAETLFANGATCDLMIISTDVLESNVELLDHLMAITAPSPKIVIYGMDPQAKLVAHCLNLGACDFLPRSYRREDLESVIANAIDKADDRPPRPTESINASIPISGWIEVTASSELEQFRRLQRFSDSLFASNLPEEVCEDLKMAVEEVGRNAVEWGNRFDPDKQVHVSYCMLNDRIIIKIEDEGEGFKPQSVPDPTADPVKTMQERASAGKRPGGYGIFLIQKLVDEVVYSEKGNTVLMTKFLSRRRDRDGTPVG